MPQQLANGKKEDILSYLTNNHCGLAEQAFVLSRGDTDEIMLMIKRNLVCIELHHPIVKRGIHEEIMELLNEQNIYGYAAIIELSDRGNKEELSAFKRHFN